MTNPERLRARWKLIKNICQLRDSKRYAAGRVRPERQDWKMKYSTNER